MMHFLLRRIRTVESMAFIVACVLFVRPVHGEKRAERTAPEDAIGGVTIEQHAQRQSTLRADLIREMPDGLMASPIQIGLTAQDIAALAVPANANGPAPLRVGIVIPIIPLVAIEEGEGLEIGLTADGGNAGFVWAISLSSPGAQAIRIHFTGFSLPANAEMYVYSPTGEAHGPYVGRGRGGTGDFWTRSITGDVGVVQLRFRGQASDVNRRQIGFQVSELAHISGRQLLAGMGSVATHDTWPCRNNVSCLVDANCVSGTPADIAKDAIARMEWLNGGFVYTCSGGLVADTESISQIPYFLTANHCLAASNPSMETYFFYATDSCNGVCPDGRVPGGTLPIPSTIGYTVLRTSTTSDFTLGTLDEPPPAGTVYLGWNNTPLANTNGEALHRISNPNFGPQVYSQHDVDSASGLCAGLPRGEYIYSVDRMGATMGGSSGSPVLNNAGEIVGQLRGCCGANCADNCDTFNNWTTDGALAFYWNQVSDLLDPVCASDSECDDGVACNGFEMCVIGKCQFGVPVVCDDGLACTVDACGEPSGLCTNTPNNETCDDGFACTTDTCLLGVGCDNDPIDSKCDDGNECTTDTCDVAVGCLNDGTFVTTACNDGDTCTTGDVCQGDQVGTCAGTDTSATDCDDGIECTSDTCDPAGGCANSPVHSACDDGIVCTTDECDSAIGCTNTPVDTMCDDGIACTTDACDPAIGCVSSPDDSACIDGNTCTMDFCDNGAGCIHDGTGVVIACSDGNACTTGDVCQGDAVGNCAGIDTSATDCDDGIACTTDTCDPVTGCSNTPSDEMCDDVNVCTADECDLIFGCINDGIGVTVSCDDDDICTIADACLGDQAGTCAGILLDTDNDLVADCVDNCPNAPNPDQADIDQDGIGDACAAPQAPVADPQESNEDRFLTFVVPIDGAGTETALRATLVSLYDPSAPLPIDPPDFSAREGEVRYVNLLRDGNGDPVTSCLSSAAFLTFYQCATLGCNPEYADWAGLFGGEPIHLSGSAIVPDSVYTISQLAASCAGNEAACVAASEELQLATARYGDADSNDLANVTDVVLTVDVVKSVLGAAWEYQCYIRKQDPEPHLDATNVTDIVLHVDAVKLFAYALVVTPCP
jgi:Dictyostelium (slime mold) repeat